MSGNGETHWLDADQQRSWRALLLGMTLLMDRLDDELDEAFDLSMAEYEILVRLSSQRFVPLVSLLMREEGRLGVVVTFLAVMELLKDSLIEIIQTEAFGPIHLKARTE